MNPNTLISQPAGIPFAKKVILHLIREELKSRKFFESLRDLGLDDAFYQVDLLELIMTPLGLKYDDQADYDFCCDLLRSHSLRVVQDSGEVWEEATRVYAILLEHTARVTKNPEMPAGTWDGDPARA